MPDEPYVSVLEELGVGAVTPPPAQPVVEPPPTPEPKTETEPKPPEPPKETKEPVKPEGNRKPASPAGEENFKTVTAKWKAEEKRAAELETKLKEREDKLAQLEKDLQELPQTKESAAKLQAQIKEREDAIEILRQEHERTRQELKAASLQRDPEFIEQYVKPRQFQAEALVGLMKDTGLATEAQVMRAVKSQNYERLLEAREQLPAHQQYRFDAILRSLEDIDLKTEAAVKDSDKTWEQIQENRKRAEMQSLQQRLEERRSQASEIIHDFKEKLDFFREDKELQETVSQIAEAAAGGKGAEDWTAKKFIGAAVAVPVLYKVNSLQAKLIEDNKATIEAVTKERDELKKKVEEQDTFIKERYGGSGDYKAPTGNGEEPYVPVYNDMQIRR